MSKKILIVQLGRIGDLILMTPTFKALKDADLDYKIHLLAGESNFHLAVDYPYIDAIHIYHKKNIFKILRLIGNLQKEKFDVWIDPKDHYSNESFYLAKFSNAKMKIGFNPQNKNLFDHNIPPDVEQQEKHGVDRNLDALIPLGCRVNITRPILFTDEKSDERLHKFFADKNIHEYYCINISASSPSRQWNSKKWKKFIDKIYQQEKKIILISAPENRESAKKIAANCANVHLYSTASIKEVFPLIKHSSLVITPDTSIVHIASAFDTPILAMFSHSKKNYNKFRPLSTIQHIIKPHQKGLKVADIPVEKLKEGYDEIVKNLKYHSKFS